ncbi:hypothetical protein [Brucella pituitosa]|uniref:Uncharacterized protein n=1 Tax=Brucella pituitosa TaxID=571256 RepID=A0A643EV44_9HYPH|nr:hypothetical protein [Brucella pituitosa]KAB0566145.1 hypothetical protein F7Q93_22150 [Brucella pituitosa]
MEKAAAIDLWSQLLERARNNEWSSFDDPNHVVSDEDREARVHAYLASGWTREDARVFEEITHQKAMSSPITSPGVNRNSEVMLQRLVKALLAGLSPSDRRLAETAHFAVEPKAGPLVSTINVMMTDQTIIAMGTHFTRYCGLVARAYVRTCNLLHWETGINFNEMELRRQLRRHPDLLLYWWRIFTSYALAGTHSLTEFRPSTREEVLLMEQMATAMEIFALAHELGHHIQSHGRQMGVDAKAEEFAADLFAARLCEQIEGTKDYQEEIQGFRFTNPYLWTGAGGILLLGSIEIFRKVKEKIFQNPRFDTHPEFAERAIKITQRNVLDTAIFHTRVEFCSSASNVLQCVLSELEPIMSVWPFAEMRARIPDDWELAQQ